MKSVSLQKFERIVQTYLGLHIADIQDERTFMQLTSYPHLENVCSNILAFFFHTEEVHHLRTLFVKSLLECAGVNADCRATENVERELATDYNNRIDIFVEIDRHLIAIENKIYSGVNNPLEDYVAHTNKLNSNRKELVFILLTLREEKGVNLPFVNVTYAMFFKAIKRNLGAYIIKANTKWLIYMNDFIKTIEDLQMGTELNKEFIDFYNENEDGINALLKARKELPKSLKAKLQDIVNLIDPGIVLTAGEFTTDVNDCSAEYYCTHLGMKQAGVPVNWDIYLDTKSCEIVIGIDGATPAQMKSLAKKLSENGLIFSSWEGNEDYFRLKQFGAFEDNEVIAKEFQHLVQMF